MTSAPAIAVVVPTFNRAERLPRLLAALEAQATLASFEVVVVSDAATDATDAVLAQLAARSPLDVRPLRTTRNEGPAAARNLGWRAARAPWVAFTDDDCTPSSGWLAALARAFERAEIVQGRTVLEPPTDGAGWFSWAPEVDRERGFYETCNIAYRRDVLERLDGFDTRFGPTGSPTARYRPPRWGEDTDLALRAKQAGARTAFVHDAVVVHDRRRGGLLDRLRESPRRAGVATVARRHPHVRGSFEAPPFFVESAHGWLLAAVGGSLLAVRRRGRGAWLLAGASLLPWVWVRGRPWPRRAWPRVLPQQLLVDAADVAVLLAASARERTLVL